MKNASLQQKIDQLESMASASGSAMTQMYEDGSDSDEIMVLESGSSLGK